MKLVRLISPDLTCHSTLQFLRVGRGEPIHSPRTGGYRFAPAFNTQRCNVLRRVLSRRTAQENLSGLAQPYRSCDTIGLFYYLLFT
ncbi:MAG: hypothetical protein IT331_11135 [Anaerolineae bacterium]|nr:hypothetical protein [Anaerolineae bacterium]